MGLVCVDMNWQHIGKFSRKYTKPQWNIAKKF